MSDADVVRAWKDRRYRERLRGAQREALPEHPAGAVRLSDEQLGGVAGGSAPEYHHSAYPCTFLCTLWCTQDCVTR